MFSVFYEDGRSTKDPEQNSARRPAMSVAGHKREYNRLPKAGATQSDFMREEAAVRKLDASEFSAKCHRRLVCQRDRSLTFLDRMSRAGLRPRC
jgi:hypothetical protein